MMVRADTSEVAKLAELLAKAPRRYVDANKRSAFGILERAVGTIRREFRSAPTTTGTATRVRTGKLRNAYGSRVSTEGDAVKGELGLVRPSIDARILAYAAVHENQGTTTIKPRGGRYLAIPLSGAMTKAGVARGGPRDFPNTFLVTSMGGSPIIAQHVGRKVIPLFVLKRSVSIKGRPALRPVFNRDVVPEMRDAVARNFDTLLQGGAA